MAAQDALVVVQVASARIVMWNPAAEALFGYSSRRAIGSPIDILLPRPIARVQIQRLAHYARTGQADVLNGPGQLNMPVKTVDGTIVHTLLELMPLAREFALMAFRRGSAEEVNVGRIEAVRATARARQQHVEALERQTAHELDTARAKARRSTDRMVRLALNPAAIEARVDLMSRVMDARVARTRALETQLDALTQLCAGGLEIANDRVNLVSMLGSIVAAMRTSRHRIKLGAPQGLRVLGDHARLDMVVRTLIDQAQRRNARGCWIDVDLRRPLAGVARIEIRDYGRQLCAAERAVLADSMTPDAAWYVCRETVVRHGGTLKIQPVMEGGLRVMITLPTNGGRVTMR